MKKYFGIILSLLLIVAVGAGVYKSSQQKSGDTITGSDTHAGQNKPKKIQKKVKISKKKQFWSKFLMSSEDVSLSSPTIITSWSKLLS